MAVRCAPPNTELARVHQLQEGSGWSPHPSPAPPQAAKKRQRPQLKHGAISYISNIVIGVASTAPAYSLAATVGFLVLTSGVVTHPGGDHRLLRPDGLHRVGL